MLKTMKELIYMNYLSNQSFNNNVTMAKVVKYKAQVNTVVFKKVKGKAIPVTGRGGP
jgi:hypothetical protein